jgi:hypothetical protein
MKIYVREETCVSNQIVGKAYYTENLHICRHQELDSLHGLGEPEFDVFCLFLDLLRLDSNARWSQVP